MPSRFDFRRNKSKKSNMHKIVSSFSQKFIFDANVELFLQTRNKKVHNFSFS